MAEYTSKRFVNSSVLVRAPRAFSFFDVVKVPVEIFTSEKMAEAKIVLRALGNATSQVAIATDSISKIAPNPVTPVASSALKGTSGILTVVGDLI